MKPVEQDLLSKLARVKQYLLTRIHRHAGYQNLITEIDLIIEEFQKNKPKIRLVGTDISLINELKIWLEKTLDLKQYYQFQTVSTEAEVKNILCGCELIFIIGDRNSKISTNDWQLIQQAKAKNVYFKVIVARDKNTEYKDLGGENISSINSWLKLQKYSLDRELIWYENGFLNLNNSESTEQDRLLFEKLIPLAKTKLQARFTNKIIHLVRKNIKNSNQVKWDRIKEQKTSFCQGNPPETLRQKINQLNQPLNKRLQHTFSRIKQKAHQHKNIINNPFLDNNLTWQTQQIIQDAEIHITKIEQQNYLTPMVRIDNSLEPLHIYLVNIYQHIFESHIKEQWNACNNVYEEVGLVSLRSEIKQKLEPISQLTDISIQQYTQENINFDLNNLVYLPILEKGSRIPFEYSFNQSQWFKIIAAAGVGTVIFIVTKMLSGEGRFFGFFILIFQFINLFTGQDIKTLKLKQQSKELKRRLESKYQILIRLFADKMTQDLIAALDREHQYYQRQIDELIQTANEKILAIKEQINRDRQQIDLLNQDLEEILALLQQD